MKTIRKLILLVPALVLVCLVFGGTVSAEAKGRLSADAEKLWITGQGQVVVTIKDRAEDEDIALKLGSKKAAKVEAGEWNGDTCVINVTALKDKSTTLTITFGTEKVKIKLYLTEEKKRTAEELYELVSKAMVEIRATDSKGNLYISSGFFVGNGRILTCQHNLEAAEVLEIVDYEGKTYKPRMILGWDEVNDLALIKTEETNKAALSFTGEIMGGERVYSIGSPAGFTGSFSAGVVAYPNRIMDNVAHIQVTIPTGIGIGGSPVFDEYGRVIGVMDMYLIAGQNMSYAIHSTVVTGFLNALTKRDRMVMADFYKKTEGKIKESNDYGLNQGGSFDSDVAGSLGLEVKDPTELYLMAYDAMVNIEVWYDAYREILGSGFFINEDTIVTNFHVADPHDVDHYVITDYYGRTYRLTRPVFYNEGADVATLGVELEEGFGEHGILDVAWDYVPATGETVYTMGSPQGEKGTFSDGIVQQPIRLFYEGIEHIAITAPITQGSSGGPLLNKYGQVIGINCLTFYVVDNCNMAVRIKYALTIEDYRQDAA